jgi:hypothetical protein
MVGFIDRKGLKKAETESQKQTGHFKVFPGVKQKSGKATILDQSPAK